MSNVTVACHTLDVTWALVTAQLITLPWLRRTLSVTAGPGATRGAGLEGAELLPGPPAHKYKHTATQRRGSGGVKVKQFC